MPKLNFDKKLVKIKSLLESWKRRTLTPIGRIQVIKSLIISQFNHLFISLPNPEVTFISQLNQVLFNFLWNSKIDKVKRNTIIMNYSDGGLKMIDIVSFIDSLKLSWIRRLFQSTSKWQNVISTFVDINILSNCGREYIQICQNKSKNKFWKDVFKAWGRLGYKQDTEILCENNLLKSPLWYNKKILINKKPIFYKEWYQRGVTLINDLIKSSHPYSFYTHEEFTQTFGVTCHFLEYNGVVSAVKKYLSLSNFQGKKVQYPVLPSCLEIFFKNVKGTKDFYSVFLRSNIVSTGRKKWNEKLDLEENSWKQVCKLPFQVTMYY